ncbi:dTDP-4-dehydrorhamnose reductase [Microbulbifer magnicolonia]|uniref:dTDP-4-dehydrorhamnose reductase n=1 Tax=Microbulbifer magnicolonia TaxID=3109744 RepID=UPI002B405089|nr:dTDP-4-dehydrorhamnose reductase [Microbulbifer sp. GG15]
MKILITGKNGQLGRALQILAPQGVRPVFLGREELNISNPAAVASVLDKVRPEVLLNAAGYTAVDKAESDATEAFAVNAIGAESLALACKEFGVRLLHVSTDFVFDGLKSSPYTVQDPVRPLGVYGESKVAGEEAVRAALPDAVIVRTAWLYSAHGNNFVNTMLRLMAERDQLGVVVDQIGTPTWAGTLARVLYALAYDGSARGVYHYTDAGAASWYDFAVAIYEEAKSVGLLPADREIQIKPIATSEYPTAAIRPQYSVLDKKRLVSQLGLDLPHWRQTLRRALEEMKCSSGEKSAPSTTHRRTAGSEVAESMGIPGNE